MYMKRLTAYPTRPRHQFTVYTVQQTGSNSIKKFKIEHFIGCGEVIVPKKLGRKQFFLHKWLANLHGFGNICKLSVAQNFKVMQSKIFQKVVFHRYRYRWRYLLISQAFLHIFYSLHSICVFKYKKHRFLKGYLK